MECPFFPNRGRITRKRSGSKYDAAILEASLLKLCNFENTGDAKIIGVAFAKERTTYRLTKLIND